MAKHVFSREGLSALQSELWALDDASLEVEACSVSRDFLSWLAARVALSVAQLEYFRGLDPVVLHFLGWSIAAALITRQPFHILGVGPEAAPGRPWALSVQSTIGLASRGTAHHADGAVTIILQEE
jgi:hypothetical protein